MHLINYAVRDVNIKWENSITVRNEIQYTAVLDVLYKGAVIFTTITN